MMDINNFDLFKYIDDIFYVITDEKNNIVSSSNSALEIYRKLLVNSILVKDENSLETEYFLKEENKWYELKETKLEENLTLKVFKDITKHKMRERSLQIDNTTGLPNKSLTDNLINNCILEAKEKNEEFSILFCDIDFFKNVNDLYGHDCGDIVLGFIGEVFRKNTRQQNNPNYGIRPLDITGRHGGEEFLIILRNIDMNNTQIKADRIKQLISESVIAFGDNQIKVTVSIGYYHVNSDELSKVDNIDSFRSEIMKKADMAMYEGKRLGRNIVVPYSDEYSSVKSKILVKNR